MSAASGESRKPTSSATSAALPNRRSAIVSARSARCRSGTSAAISRDRMTGSGVIALTLTLNRAAWPASDRTNPSTPGRVWVRSAAGAWSYSPQTEDTATIRP
jgi:hypothetical protein